MLATIDFAGAILTLTLRANEKVVVSNPASNQIRFNVTPYSPSVSNGGGLSIGGGGTLGTVIAIGGAPIVPSTGITSVTGSSIGFSAVGYGSDTTGTLPSAVSLVIKGASGSAQAVDFQQSTNGAFITSSRISVDLGNDANDDVMFSGAIDRTGVMSGDAVQVMGVRSVSFRDSINVSQGSIAITASATPRPAIVLDSAAFIGATTGNVALSSQGSVSSFGTIATTGAVDITASANIQVTGSITAGHGGVNLNANLQAVRTLGSFVGIDVFGGTITTTGNGNIVIRGRGSSFASSVQNPDGHGHGVRITRGGTISSAGTGAVIISGAGGLAMGEPTISQAIALSGSTSSNNAVTPMSLSDPQVSTNDFQATQGTSGVAGALAGFIGLYPVNFSHGVLIDGFQTKVSSESGRIDIAGLAGNDWSSHGVYVNSALVESRGGLPDSSISITGTVANPGGYKVGILIDGGVKSDSAPIIINGNGEGASVGFESRQAAFVQASAPISITGIGAARGVLVGRYSTVSSATGLVDLVGNATASGSFGLAIESGAVASSVNGPVRLMSDSVQIDGAATLGAKTVMLRPRTPGARVDLGGADGVTGVVPVLGLTNGELNRVFAETLIVGSPDGGESNVTAPIALLRPTDVVLRAGAGIGFNGGSLNTGGKSLFLAPGNSPAAVKGLTPGIDATASTVALTSALGITLNGHTEDSEYTRLKVNGAVSLAGVDLVVSGSNTVPGEFVIVEGTRVVGTFNGLPSGSTVMLNGVPMVITYAADRVTLASPSNATAGLVGRGLVVSGGATSDSVQILRGPVPKSYVVKGLGRTTVNGQSSVIVRNVTAGWRIDLGQGNDVLLAGAANSPVSVTGSVRIDVGTQGATTLVRLERLTVSGALTVRSTGRFSQVNMVRVDVGGQFTFVGSPVDDQLSIQGSRFRQHVSIVPDAGHNRLTISGTAFQRTVAINFALIGVNGIDAGLLSTPIGRSKGNSFATRPQITGPANRLS